MTEPPFPLPCIICGRKLEPVNPEWTPRQPWAGTTFISYGQYGSTVFDDTGDRYLEVNFCDPCVREKAALGLIVVGVKIRRPDDVEYSTWAPYGSEGAK